MLRNFSKQNENKPKKKYDYEGKEIQNKIKGKPMGKKQMNNDCIKQKMSMTDLNIWKIKTQHKMAHSVGTDKWNQYFKVLTLFKKQ